MPSWPYTRAPHAVTGWTLLKRTTEPCQSFTLLENIPDLPLAGNFYRVRGQPDLQWTPKLHA